MELKVPGDFDELQVNGKGPLIITPHDDQKTRISVLSTALFLFQDVSCVLKKIS